MKENKQTNSKPNIIFIILDTQRFDRLGCYGYHRNTSPNLDAFAESAILFENAIAPAQWTIPSHASMFTGLPPSTHHTTQANSVLDDQFPTFAEILANNGYNTVGFCNNPLVGLIHNNLRRGFKEFYNYSGTIPNVPRDFPNSSIFPYQRIWEHILDLIQRILDPIQNKFSTSTELLQIATHPIFVPLWTRFVHFKGLTSRSIKDTFRYIRSRTRRGNKTPYLLFLNLMETHLPFMPPKEYIDKFATGMKKNKKARKFMRNFNNQAMQWLIPLKKMFTEMESQTLSDMYDAEVAYQDHLLGRFLELLQRDAVLSNSLVIIAADHGEMLGEHQFMGHSFGVYKELVQVPLIIRMPGQKEGFRVSDPILTTNLFHTILDAAGIPEFVNEAGIHTDAHKNSLITQYKNGPVISDAVANENVISEAYAPHDAMQMMEKYEPELVQKFSTRKTHRAVYSKTGKLYDIEGIRAQLLHLDDSEQEPDPEKQQELSVKLQNFISDSKNNLPAGWQAPKVNLSDPFIEQRLRDLGYMA